MKVFDINIVLRYLLKAVPGLFEIAKTNRNVGDCAVYPKVTAEAVYVLKSVCKVERIEILIPSTAFRRGNIRKKRGLYKRSFLI